MSATFNELLDAGVCKGGCLMAVPDTRCDCRCGGYFHAWVTNWIAERARYSHPEQAPPVIGADHRWFFPGFADIDVIQRGRRAGIIDHTENVRLWGRSA